MDCRVDGETPPIQNFQLVPEFSWQYVALHCLDEKHTFDVTPLLFE